MDHELSDDYELVDSDTVNEERDSNTGIVPRIACAEHGLMQDGDHQLGDQQSNVRKEDVPTDFQSWPTGDVMVTAKHMVAAFTGTTSSGSGTGTGNGSGTMLVPNVLRHRKQISSAAKMADEVHTSVRSDRMHVIDSVKWTVMGCMGALIIFLLLFTVRNAAFKRLINARSISCLEGGTSLANDEKIVSHSNTFFAIMQRDGDLVVYRNTTFGIPFVKWTTAWTTQGKARDDVKGTAPYSLRMQTNGNLEILDANGKVTWSSETRQYFGGRARAVVTDEGRIAVMRGSATCSLVDARNVLFVDHHGQ